MVTEKETFKNEKANSLPDAFKQLEAARMHYTEELLTHPKKHKKNKHKSYNVYYSGSSKSSKKNKSINQDKLSFRQWLDYRINKLRYDKDEIKKLCFITSGIFAVCITLASTNYIFAQYNKEEEIKQKIATNVFETNSESLNLDKIIIDNVGIKKSKAIVNDEEREVAFETKKQDNPNLPKGEEKVSQDGKIGKKLVNCIKTYQDDEFVDENILEEKIVEEPITQIIDVGTSEFLAKYQVHIGDKMYVTENLSLKEKPEDTSNNLCIILATLDVTLQELNDEWCKVTYESYTGYVKSSLLTSEAVTPGIGEKNRVQKIRSTLDANMSLNKPSGLTLEDFKKILSNNASDTNKIFEQNAEVFYNVEQKYNINGIFLASMAIHESGWGSSKIAKDKKNLFGFGAYDRSPYDSAVTFATYEEGIETVAKYLVKNYINEKNAKIYNNETATGTYYNGPTLVGISTRYCSDKDWPTKVYKYMNYLYERL